MFQGEPQSRETREPSGEITMKITADQLPWNDA
jgi:hypothetical protein